MIKVFCTDAAKTTTTETSMHSKLQRHIPGVKYHSLARYNTRN